MDLISLRYALETSQYQSFRAAAKSLGIGQSALRA